MMPLRSKGRPKYLAWLYNIDTNKWDCWGEVHSAEDYPDLVERINNQEVLHTLYQGSKYSKVYYQNINDVGETPNKLGLK